VSLAVRRRPCSFMSRFNRARSGQALALDPSDTATSARLCFDLGNVLHIMGRHDDAATCYEKAINLQPTHAEAWYNLGVARSIQARLSDAIACYQEALRLRPNYTDAHNNLGTLLQALGRDAEAVEHYRKADSVEARYNLGLWLQQRDRPEDAELEYRRVLERNPGHAEACNNLGNVALALGRAEDALCSYLRALELNANHAEAHWNLALTQLLLGQFEDGWRGYEWRFLQTTAEQRQFPEPLWDGSPLDGRRILLHAEQGLGDVLQFIRYAPLVHDRGGRVTLECHPPLIRLLASVRGVDRLVELGKALPEYDCHAPLLSLPRIFGTRLETIPSETSYLKPDPERVRHWRAALERWPRPRVALTWSGNPDHKENSKRSLPAEALVQLAIPGVCFFALQKGPPEILEAPPALHLHWIEDESTDLSDTAAILEHLDLVISVDTSIAHLAGALGRPVWTLLPFAADWRWLRGREDCPWYPTMRLFRQERRGDWGSVLVRVREELQKHYPR
jgi:tetratricopeptide (TPR) repeat protein